ncbi:TPA: hypothetical protein PXQ25_003714 [Yersinia enterocolitica]|uniref:hypothetical protein n=1 Tax=Yersinia enterocolitica TaxID=630 RepID=UPI00065A90DD|nr:hypothetical protein [Yersinia enterocolitica]CRX93160.1 Uncharacterised protein [Yersinia enterocolitica]HDL7145396.1 hypothetical protein [Yersinia enterocolitica]HDL8132553.1 hypothetical protein [Yersinia enterocolitica]
MITPDWILIAVCTLMGTAAWQKPKFYKDELAKILPFVFGFLILVLGIWSAAIGNAVSTIPIDLDPKIAAVVRDGILRVQAPALWTFYLLIAIAVEFICTWIAKRLISAESKKWS